MNDDDINRELRTWGEAGRAAESGARFSAEHLSARPARRYLVLAGAAAAIIAIALAAVLIPRGSRSPTNTADGADSSLKLTGSAVAPTGYRAVTVHGLTIDVPAAWPIDAVGCGTPMKDTVIYPQGVVPACALARPPKVTSVEFRPGVWTEGRTSPPPQAERLQISHVSAFRLAATNSEGLYTVTYSVPTLEVTVVITSPVPATAQKLASTLRLTASDTDGCSSIISPILTLSTGGKPARSGADHAVIPGTPTRITMCRYVAGFVERGVELTAVQQAQLVDTLNAQPRGLSVVPPEDYLASAVCQPKNATTRQAFAQFSDDAAFYRVQADYDTGPPVVVFIRLGQCNKLGASNGSYAVQRTDVLAKLVIKLVPANIGWPTRVVPAK